MSKIYVITGAASGIGKALTEHFSEKGIVYAGVRRTDAFAELEKASPNIIPFYIDLCDDESVKRATEFIKSKTNRVDTLINTAGCVVAGAMESIPVSELRRQFDTNVFGCIGLTQGLLDILEGGRVINISSMASYGIFPFIAPYCASKRAMDILFNSLLMETKRDIKIISIKPGVIATPLWDKSIEQNKVSIQNCTGYEAEMAYMIKNAGQNGQNGAPVESVVKVVDKADCAAVPKLTYTVGKDAFAARIVAKLPQKFVNSIIKSKVRKIAGGVLSQSDTKKVEGGN